jgi:Tannase and feruloyl esterase
MTMKTKSLRWLPVLLLLPALGAAGASRRVEPKAPAGAATDPAVRCQGLARLAVPNATVSVATLVAAGAFVGPPAVFTGQDLKAFYASLPPFCRIAAEARPTPDSSIKIEVWMPASGWNGRLQGLGNGGFAGLLDHQQMGAAMSEGYAATVTDAGHEGSPVDATWALGHPEKVVDFGHRGIHEMTRVAKAMLRAFYGDAPRRSYFAGCSDGGREALMEAQRYPADYDGILAGAPASDWTHLLASSMWNSQALMLDPASFVPPEKIKALASAVVAACDAIDGVRDGILNDPRQCRFDPATLLCHGAESPQCLTQPQVTAISKVLEGPRDSHGRQVFPPYMRGAEGGPGGWATWITGPAPGKSLMYLFGTGYFSNMVYEKADWDYRTFALGPALEAAEAKTGSALDATDPDLRPFAERGGKLILYHGWDDPAIPALSTVGYYRSVVARIGQGAADRSVRLYMVPGMQHCGGGPGADSFGEYFGMPATDAAHDVRLALEQWVEKGLAPSALIAAKPEAAGPTPRPKLTRLLCPYPATATYDGTGDTTDASSYACRPEHGR